MAAEAAGVAFALRPMGLPDLPGVLALERECFSPAHWSAESFRVMFERESAVMLVALCPDGGLLGYAVAERALDEAEVLKIAVRCDTRGRGLGRALLRAVLGQLRAHECVKVYLEVREGNHVARAMYGAEGFRQIGVRRDYYDAPRENAVTMSLEISSWSPGA